MRFVVSGTSMEPAFSPGDKLFVCRFFYKFFKPKAGDVVVIQDPRGGRLLLKRIESVDRKGILVKGDNTAESTDSRTFGIVPPKLIAGRVIFKYSGLIKRK
jgi:nickel-type superoxide dismutase maturation protease